LLGSGVWDLVLEGDGKGAFEASPTSCFQPGMETSEEAWGWAELAEK